MPVKGSRIYNYYDFSYSDVEVTDTATISLKDRVPPGKYAIVRNLYAPLSTIVDDAIALDLTGLIFLLSNSNVEQASFSPSYTGGNSWNIIQNAIYSQTPLDFTGVGNATIHGAKVFRQKDKTLCIGGLFVCGKMASISPREEAFGIADIMNNLQLDFACLDFDGQSVSSGYDWQENEAGSKILLINQYMLDCLKMFPRKIASQFPWLSSYRPVFNVLPSNTVGSEKMLSSDGVFEVFQNGFTSPRAFGMPRISSSQPPSSVSDAWNWAKPLEGQLKNMGRCEIIVDVRSGMYNAGNIVNSAVNGVTKEITKGVNVTAKSGVVVYDDIEALKKNGSAPGATPSNYWDYDKKDVWGSYCVGFWKAPLIPAIVGKKFEYSIEEINIFSKTTTDNKIQFLLNQYIVIENWKTGHIAGHRPDVLAVHPSLGLNPSNVKQDGSVPVYPEYFTLTDSYGQKIDYQYPRTSVWSWLKIGSYVASEPFIFQLTRDLSTGGSFSPNVIVESVGPDKGGPVRGDEGTYPILMEVYRKDPKGVKLDSDLTEMSLFLQVVRDTKDDEQIIQKDANLTDAQKNEYLSKLNYFNSYYYNKYTNDTFNYTDSSTRFMFSRSLTKRIPQEWGPLNLGQEDAWAKRIENSSLYPYKNIYAASNDTSVYPLFRKQDRVFTTNNSTPTSGPPPDSYNVSNPTAPELDYFKRAPYKVRQAIAQSGFPWKQWEFAARVSWNESGWDPNALNILLDPEEAAKQNRQPEYSVGIFQINTLAWKTYTIDQLKDENINARQAYQVWLAQGWDVGWVHSFAKITKEQIEAGVPPDKRIPAGIPTRDNSVTIPGSGPTSRNGVLRIPFEKGIEYKISSNTAQHGYPALDLAPVITGKRIFLLAPTDVYVTYVGYAPLNKNTSNVKSANYGVICEMSTVNSISGLLLDITFAHMSSEVVENDLFTYLTVPRLVKAGEPVGIVGHTGYVISDIPGVPADHVHIEVKTTPEESGYEIPRDQIGLQVDPELYWSIPYNPENPLITA